MKGLYCHSPEVEAALSTFMRDFVAAEHAEKPRIDAIVSRIEGKEDTITIVDHLEVNAASRGLFHEVAHIHGVRDCQSPTAGRLASHADSFIPRRGMSPHTILGPACAAEVVSKKWGVRQSGRKHQLGPLRGHMCHHDLVFLYPPKTLDEVEMIKTIATAGMGYALDVANTDGPAGSPVAGPLVD